MNRFETLHHRYLNQTASKEEVAEFFELIGTGEYDDLLGSKILQELESEVLLLESEEERARMEGIYDRKLKNHLWAEVPKAKVMGLKSWLAAAAVVAGVLFGSWWLLGKRSDQRSLSLQKEVQHTADASLQLTRFTDKQLVHLPDGSTVLLNEGSELTYNQEDFGKAGRDVILTGEGFFDVRHNAAKPFVVHTGNVNTTVLGTAFNVTALPNQQQIRVTVTRGKVKVGDQSRTYDVITPDQQIVVNTATYDFTKEIVNAKSVTEWKDRFVILDNVTMAEAVAMLAQRFEVKLVLTNAGLENCHVSASFFNGENLEHILKVIAAVNQLSYVVHADGAITLNGGEQCQ